MDSFNQDLLDKRFIKDVQKRFELLNQDMALTRMELNIYRKRVNKLTKWVRLFPIIIIGLIIITIGLNV